MSTIRGRTVMWCMDCRVWFPASEEGFTNTCPRCGRYLRMWKCIRCGHEWVPRNTRAPAKVCPHCHSRYWNRTRVMR